MRKSESELTSECAFLDSESDCFECESECSEEFSLPKKSLNKNSTRKEKGKVSHGTKDDAKSGKSGFFSTFVNMFKTKKKEPEPEIAYRSEERTRGMPKKSMKKKKKARKGVEVPKMKVYYSRPESKKCNF